jgi:hypothetical protein
MLGLGVILRCQVGGVSKRGGFQTTEAETEMSREVVSGLSWVGLGAALVWAWVVLVWSWGGIVIVLGGLGMWSRGGLVEVWGWSWCGLGVVLGGSGYGLGVVRVCLGVVWGDFRDGLGEVFGVVSGRSLGWSRAVVSGWSWVASSEAASRVVEVGVVRWWSWVGLGRWSRGGLSSSDFRN